MAVDLTRAPGLRGRMSFVAVFVGSIIVLVVVTRIAGKRDAVRKAELAARAQPDQGSDESGT